MKWMFDIVAAFLQGLLSKPIVCKPHEECLGQEKELREHLSEKQVDKMVECSFPASDPPSTY